MQIATNLQVGETIFEFEVHGRCSDDVPSFIRLVQGLDLIIDRSWHPHLHTHFSPAPPRADSMIDSSTLNY